MTLRRLSEDLKTLAFLDNLLGLSKIETNMKLGEVVL